MTQLIARARTGEEGTTLVELLISLSILGIVLGSVLAVMASVQKGLGTQIDRTANAMQAGVAMQQFQKEIQSAEAFTICSSSTCGTANQLANGTSCTATSATTSSLTTCYLVVFTQTNAATRQATSPGPNAPFSCVQWRVASLGTTPAAYAIQSRRWQPDWETNASSLVTGWRYVTDALPTAAMTLVVPSTQMLGGRLIRVTVAVNNQSANKASQGNPTNNLSITREFTGSNILSTYNAGTFSTGNPNPCVPPTGTIPS
jgi:type II secretory pathway component PulJ